METDHHLKPITIQRKRFAHSEHTLYRVYSAPGEFQLVEAKTAHEAFERSGVARPHKIERETFYGYPALPARLVSHEAEGEIEVDPSLPDAADLKAVLYAALMEGDDEADAPAFESLMVADLQKKKPQARMPEPEPEPAPAFEAAPPPVPSDEALTPEQVEALLRGE